MSSIKLADKPSPARRWVLLGLAVVIPLVAVIVLLPRVARAVPRGQEAAVPLAESVAIEFNWPMNRSSVEDSFVLNPQVAGETKWQGTEMRFTPTATWPERSTIEVTLGSGVRSALGLPLLGGLQFSFTTSQARVLYAWPQSGPAQLYRSTLDGTDLRQLTEVEGGIRDFDASPVRPVAYLTSGSEAADNGILRLDLDSGESDLLRSCPVDQACSQVSLSPDGLRLAFSAGGGDPETDAWEGHVEVINLSEPGGTPMWESPVGASSPEWVNPDLLAFIDRSQGDHVLVDLAAQEGPTERTRIPDELGQSGTWSPDGRFWVGSQVEFLTPEVGALSEFFSHLVRVEVSTGSRVDLTGRRAGLVEDGTPAYSPDGTLIAFGRKYLDVERWTLGRQIWVMRADGSQTRPLTDFPIYHHSGFVWSPDGTRLLAQRFDQADPTTPGDVGWIDLESGRWTTLAEGAFLPRWTP